MSNSPKLFIISGCNGAGKTTAATTILPEVLGCRHFVNADEIAKGLSPLDPDAVQFLAGRIMLRRIAALMKRHETFAIETTLSTRSYASLVRRARAQGYDVELLYVWLESVDAARMRVARRVAEGGHNIPPEVIERRYTMGLKNLFDVFMPIVDFWTVVDNSRGRLEIVASSRRVENQSTFTKIKEKYDRSRNG